MRRNPIVWLFLIISGVAFILGAGGCAGSEVEKKEDNFHRSAKIYNERLRWQQLDVASQFVADDQIDAFLEHYAGQRDTLSITEVELISTNLDRKDPDKGTARVFVTYFKLPDSKVRRVLQKQEWRYEEGTDRWLIELPYLPKDKSAQKKSD